MWLYTHEWNGIPRKTKKQTKRASWNRLGIELKGFLTIHPSTSQACVFAVCFVYISWQEVSFSVFFFFLLDVKISSGGVRLA